MKEMLKRLDEINTELRGLVGQVGDYYNIRRTKLRSERDGIVFAIKCLGLTPTDNLNEGWSVCADGKEDKGDEDNCV